MKPWEWFDAVEIVTAVVLIVVATPYVKQAYNYISASIG